MEVLNIQLGGGRRRLEALPQKKKPPSPQKEEDETFPLLLPPPTEREPCSEPYPFHFQPPSSYSSSPSCPSSAPKPLPECGFRQRFCNLA